MAILEKSERPAFPEGPCDPRSILRLEITEEMEERIWGLPEAQRTAGFVPSNLGQAVSPLCASASSFVNGEL